MINTEVPHLTTRTLILNIQLLFLQMCLHASYTGQSLQRCRRNAAQTLNRRNKCHTHSNQQHLANTQGQPGCSQFSQQHYWQRQYGLLTDPCFPLQVTLKYTIPAKSIKYQHRLENCPCKDPLKKQATLLCSISKNSEQGLKITD